MWGDGRNLGQYSLWMWGFSLTQTCIFGLLFLEPKDIQSISLGAIWSFSKVSGLTWLDMRHKEPALKPRCIGAVTSLTFDILSLSLSLLIYEAQGLQNNFKEYKINSISCNIINRYSIIQVHIQWITNCMFITALARLRKHINLLRIFLSREV
jgi:hypothetical protein